MGSGEPVMCRGAILISRNRTDQERSWLKRRERAYEIIGGCRAIGATQFDE